MCGFFYSKDSEMILAPLRANMRHLTDLMGVRYIARKCLHTDRTSELCNNGYMIAYSRDGIDKVPSQTKSYRESTPDRCSPKFASANFGVDR